MQKRHITSGFFIRVNGGFVLVDAKSEPILIDSQIVEVPKPRPYKKKYNIGYQRVKKILESFCLDNSQAEMTAAKLLACDGGILAHNLGRMAIAAAEINNPALTEAVQKIIRCVGKNSLDYIQPGTLTLGMAYMEFSLPARLPKLDNDQRKVLRSIYCVVEDVIKAASIEAAEELRERIIMAPHSKHNKPSVKKLLPNALYGLGKVRPGLVNMEDMQRLINNMAHIERYGYDWSPTGGG